MCDEVHEPSNRTQRAAYTRVIIPDLTDEELVAHQFVIDAPLLLPNLSEEEPPRDQDLMLVGRYKLRDAVKCVFGHRHKSGFAFRAQDGRHFLVGRICGTKVMGVEEWEAFDREQSSLEQRADYLRQIKALQDALRRRRDWIARLRTSPPIVALAGVRNMLNNRRELADAIRSAFRFHDGRVNRVTKVRSIEAEIRREEREQDEIDRFNALSPTARTQYLLERAAPTLTRGHLFEEHLIDIGMLAGRSLFMEHYASAGRMRELLEQIDALLAFETMLAQTSQLKRTSVQARTVLSNLIGIRGEIEDAIAFFSSRNLETLSLWANDRAYDDATYAAGRATLLIHDGRNGRDIRIARPESLQSLDPEGFAELQAAATTFSRAAQ